jgi:hypothetical protein
MEKNRPQRIPDFMGDLGCQMTQWDKAGGTPDLLCEPLALGHVVV